MVVPVLMQAGRVDVKGGNIERGQSGADDIARGRYWNAAGFAALIHVAHLHLFRGFARQRQDGCRRQT